MFTCSFALSLSLSLSLALSLSPLPLHQVRCWGPDLTSPSLSDYWRQLPVSLATLRANQQSCILWDNHWIHIVWFVFSCCVVKETWEKRRGYFEGVVDYISRASHKTEHQKADYSDVVSFLFQTVLDLSMQGTSQLQLHSLFEKTPSE